MHQKTQAVYASARQKYEGGHWGRTLRRKTHCISRCVRRHICNTPRRYCPMSFSSSWKTMSATISRVCHWKVSFLSVRLFWCCLVLLRYEDLGMWRHFSGFVLPNLSFFCLFAFIFSVQSALRNANRMTRRGWGGKEVKGEGKEKDGGCWRDEKFSQSSKVPLLDSFPYAARVLTLRQTSGHVVLHKCLNPLDITITTHTRILGWLGRAHLRAPYEDTDGVSCVTVPCLSRACDVLLSGSLQGDSAAVCCSFCI